jgi:hypothetical protein
MTNTKMMIRRAESLLADYNHCVRQVKDEVKALKAARDHQRWCEQAQQICQDVAKAVQEKAHNQIAGVVTRCLQAVFDHPYEFRITFSKKRGKTEAGLGFFRDGQHLDPNDGVGGSVLEVAAFALRLSCLMLRRPARRKIILLDEPFRAVSDRKGNRDRVRRLLETLSSELGFQIILVTHDKKLQAGKVIEI